MACNKNKYAPNVQREKTNVNISFAKYENKGTLSKIINNYG
jgi:hypothetical protein